MNKKNYISLNILSFIFISLALIFAYGRVINLDRGSPDFAVWILISEILNRGETLYIDIYDHKDLGFLLLNKFVYKYLDISGMYLLSYTLMLLNAYTLYLSLEKHDGKSFADRQLNIILSISYLVLITNSPFFVSVSVENISIQIILISINFLRMSLFTLGITTLSLSIFFKVSNIFLFFPILFFHLKKINFKLFIIYIFSIIILYSQYPIIFNNWYDVNLFNTNYSLQRRGNVEYSINTLYSTIIIIISNKYILINFLILIILNINIKFSVLKRNCVYIFLIASQLFILSLQYPPGLHHFQMLYAVLVIYTTLIFKEMYYFKYINLNVTYISASILLFVFLLYSIYSERVRFITFSNINKPGHAYEIVNKIKLPGNYIILGSSGYKPDIRNLPKNSKLGCKFVYQLGGMLNYYHNEIKDCYLGSYDYVFYDILEREDIIIKNYDQLFINKLKVNNYFECFSKDGSTVVYSKVSIC
jgi:hypothetical protein